MVHRLQNRIEFYVSASTYIWLALMLLILPLPWVFSVSFAAAFHELCHYLAVRLCGGDVMKLTIGNRGMTMDVLPLTPGKEVFCALSGPIGGMLLLFMMKRLPRIAICSLALSLYNLIPVYPFDGGRAVLALLTLVFQEERGAKISAWVSGICIFVLWGLALYSCVWLNIGILPILFMSILTIRVKSIKNPCKGRK